MAVVKHALPRDPKHLKVAFEHLGLKEIPGPRHESRIVAMFAAVGYAWVTDDETAWCTAFVGYCLKAAGEPYTSSLAARSYSDYGKPTESPDRGDIAVFRRGRGWQGHVAFYLGETATRVWIIGGNQSDAVTVTTMPKSKLIGYRKLVRLHPITGNSRTTKAQAAVATGAAVAGASEAVDKVAMSVTDAGATLQTVSNISPWLTALGAALIVAGVGITLWARMRDWEVKAR